MADKQYTSGDNEFEWDENENKNESNQQKHFISFEYATNVFSDHDRIDTRSNENSEERRITIGKVVEKLYTAIYTMRETVIRMISARRANKKETKAYNDKNSN